MLIGDLMSVVYNYLDHALSLEQLEDWIVPRLPLVFEVPESPVAKLAGSIEFGLAEIGEGLIDEEEFRKRLEAAIQQQETLVFFHPADSPIIETASSNDALPETRILDWSQVSQTVQWVVQP